MLWIIFSIIVIALDRITKYIVVDRIGLGQMIPIIDDFFYLTLHKNTGAAWGVLREGRLFFLIITPIIAAVVLFYMSKNKNRLLRFSLALILGGAVGNYIDRLLAGEVTDFLLFYIGSYPFPIFNVADIAITCGTFLLAVYILFIYKEPVKGTAEDSGHEIQEAEVQTVPENMDNGTEQEDTKEEENHAE